MINQIDIEKSIHGDSWGKIHGGYFSNSENVKPLVNSILNILKRDSYDAVVDLGGGTGFLLSELMSQYDDQNMNWINLDCSDVQLTQSHNNKIKNVTGYVNSFKREEFVSEKTSVLWTMRSVLHYFGKNGLAHTLRYLRTQIKKGEFFIHQTASFKDAKDADCLNMLYKMMRTEKWYPTVEQLTSNLAETGWDVLSVQQAPPLPLFSTDLGRRYTLNQQNVDHIRSTIPDEFDVSEDVFRLFPEGFQANLFYYIFVCQAV